MIVYNLSFSTQLVGLLYVYAFFFLYSAIVFVINRERLYLFQSLFALGILANAAITSGFAVDIGIFGRGLIAWDEWPRVTYLFLLVSALGMIIAGLYLARDFLMLKCYYPRLDRFIKWLPLPVCTALAALFFIRLWYAILLVNAIGLVIVVLFIALSVAIARKGHAEAIFQLLTFSFFLAGSVVYSVGSFIFASSLQHFTKFAFYYGAAASLVLMAIGVARRMNTLKSERESIKSLFGSYVSAQVVEEILQKHVGWEGEEREATILFTDIRNYTSLVEKVPPKEIIRILNEYYEVIVDIINRRNGIVNKFIGDSVMAVFNVPLDQVDHAALAVQAGREIVAVTEARTFGNLAAGPLTLRTNVGIHTGRVVVGNVGGTKRLEYSVLGDAVNMASRLEQLNKEYGTPLLLSGETARLLGEPASVRMVSDRVTIRGRTQPCSVFTLG